MIWVVNSLLPNSFITGASSREVNQTEIFFSWKLYKESLQLVRLEVQHVSPSVKPMARGLWWKEIIQYSGKTRRTDSVTTSLWHWPRSYLGNYIIDFLSCCPYDQSPSPQFLKAPLFCPVSWVPLCMVRNQILKSFFISKQSSPHLLMP